MRKPRPRYEYLTLPIEGPLNEKQTNDMILMRALFGDYAPGLYHYSDPVKMTQAERLQRVAEWEALHQPRHTTIKE